jgi:hypothetical protein
MFENDSNTAEHIENSIKGCAGFESVPRAIHDKSTRFHHLLMWAMEAPQFGTAISLFLCSKAI